MTASAAEVEAAQKAMREHWADWADGDKTTRGWYCTCGSFFGRDEDCLRHEHRAQAVADAVVAAAQPRIAAETLREAAAEARRLGTATTNAAAVHAWLRMRANRIEAQS